MTQHAEALAKAASTASYGVSGFLVAGDWLQFLNQNAAACGVILGFLTFCANIVFQWMNHKAIIRRNREDDDL